tara:strand:- start:3251 stop:3577 length:327 start_codon:yes stop_codon:yes gene_type:complete
LVALTVFILNKRTLFSTFRQETQENIHRKPLKSGGTIYRVDSNSSAPFISRADLSDSGNQETLLNSINLTNSFGLVAIPEPSTYALMADNRPRVGIFMRHRKRKQLEA